MSEINATGLIVFPVEFDVVTWEITDQSGSVINPVYDFKNDELNITFGKYIAAAINDYETNKQRIVELEEGIKQIRSALQEYHAALTARKHGGVAAGRFVDEVENILDMHWQARPSGDYLKQEKI